MGIVAYYSECPQVRRLGLQLGLALVGLGLVDPVLVGLGLGLVCPVRAPGHK